MMGHRIFNRARTQGTLGGQTPGEQHPRESQSRVAVQLDGSRRGNVVGRSPPVRKKAVYRSLSIRAFTARRTVAPRLMKLLRVARKVLPISTSEGAHPQHK